MSIRAMLMAFALVSVGISTGMQQCAAQMKEQLNESAQIKQSVSNPDAQRFSADNVPSETKAEKLSGRLPRYFASVVRPEQRQAIYRIQAEYRKEIEKLQAQLHALKQRESDKIFDVLSEEQRGLIAEMNSAARLTKTDRSSPPAGLPRQASGSKVLP